ncbi:hypothetical protein [Edaphobacter bradus]|uniref:hypothetical protein n=1 Tax=Edaphobacter bradus TaxID=2259016 RepID=UPI0021E08988|nr:hypothetical protein [Edaphobacter bradus]
MIVCSVVFGSVATAAYIFRDEGKRLPPASIGSTYAVQGMNVYQGTDMTGPPSGVVPRQGQLEITGFKLAGNGKDWIQVRSRGVSGYVHPSEVAPPKVSNREQGYLLLKGFLGTIDNPSLMSLAVDSVDSYRHYSGADARADELDWTLAEHLRTLKSGEDLARVERLEYSKLAAKPGEYQQRAEARMAELSARTRSVSQNTTHLVRR